MGSIGVRSTKGQNAMANPVTGRYFSGQWREAFGESGNIERKKKEGETNIDSRAIGFNFETKFIIVGCLPIVVAALVGCRSFDFVCWTVRFVALRNSLAIRFDFDFSISIDIDFVSYCYSSCWNIFLFLLLLSSLSLTRSPVQFGAGRFAENPRHRSDGRHGSSTTRVDIAIRISCWSSGR